MVAAVVERCTDIHDREAGDRPLREGVADAFLDGREEVPGHSAAHDAIGEFEVLAVVEWLELQQHMSILAGTARLLLVLVLGTGLCGDGLPIGDAWEPEIDLDVRATLHPLDRDLDVRLAHAGDDSLARIGIPLHT